MTTIKVPVQGDEYIEFIECQTLSISYDIMGIATVSYNLISNRDGLRYWQDLTFGDPDVTFEGYVSTIDSTDIHEVDGWNENHVTHITTTN